MNNYNMDNKTVNQTKMLSKKLKRKKKQNKNNNSKNINNNKNVNSNKMYNIKVNKNKTNLKYNCTYRNELVSIIINKNETNINNINLNNNITLEENETDNNNELDALLKKWENKDMTKLPMDLKQFAKNFINKTSYNFFIENIKNHILKGHPLFLFSKYSKKELITMFDMVRVRLHFLKELLNNGTFIYKEGNCAPYLRIYKSYEKPRSLSHENPTNYKMNGLFDDINNKVKRKNFLRSNSLFAKKIQRLNNFERDLYDKSSDSMDIEENDSIENDINTTVQKNKNNNNMENNKINISNKYESNKQNKIKPLKENEKIEESPEINLLVEQNIIEPEKKTIEFDPYPLINYSFKFNKNKIIYIKIRNEIFPIIKINLPDIIGNDQNKILKIILLFAGIDYEYYPILKKEIIRKVDSLYNSEVTSSETLKELNDSIDYIDIIFLGPFCMEYKYSIVFDMIDTVKGHRLIDPFIFNKNAILFLLMNENEKKENKYHNYDAYIRADAEYKIPEELHKNLKLMITKELDGLNN